MNMALSFDPGKEPRLPPASERDIAAARFYEDKLVPALFSQYAPRMIEAADIGAAHRVLDVACGTGILARGIAAVTGPDSPPAGVDISPGMLAVARDLDAGVDWHHGDAVELPFADAAFDRVVCQFGLMFFTDAVKALREMLRVLKPGGHLAVAVWNSIAKAPGSAAMVDILERMAGSRAADALRLPYSLGEIGDLESLARAAGYGEFEIETHAGEARFPALGVLIDAEIRGWLPVMDVRLDETLVAAIEDECARCFRHWIDPVDGVLCTPTSAHILTTVRRSRGGVRG
jgi:SAM-dependent methyltransferase